MGGGHVKSTLALPGPARSRTEGEGCAVTPGLFRWKAIGSADDPADFLNDLLFYVHGPQHLRNVDHEEELGEQ